MKIPVSVPYLDEDDKKHVIDALNSGEISGTFGKYIGEFERNFSVYCNAKHGLAVSNGSNALHLAVVVLGIKNGDEVLVSTFTNMATFFAVLHAGAKPIPIDVDPRTLNINPDFLEAKITERTRAIIVVHIYGHPVDMDPILEIAKKHNLYVIEDAAEAHGAEYKGKKVGALGDLGVFSFYANKIISTGEGGMLVGNDDLIMTKARSLGGLAYGKKENRFMHSDIGFNFRLPNLQAALGVSQLKKIDWLIAQRRRVADFYTKHLSVIEGLELPVEESYAKNVYWMYSVALRGRLENKRKEITTALKDFGVDTRDAFTPFNMQKIAIERGLANENDCPVANYAAKNSFYLPTSPSLKEEELNYVVASLRQIIEKHHNE